jgi:hypothetical protein
MANLSAIRSSLDTNLKSVTQVKEVLLGRSAKFTKFPSCRHYLVGIGDADEDNVRNYRTYKFGIDLLMPLEANGMTRATAEATFQDAVEALMDKLNQHWADSVERSAFEVGTVREEDAPFGVCAVISFVWIAQTLRSIV